MLGGAPGHLRLSLAKVAGSWRVRLSDRIIFGLLAVAVLSSANTGQEVPDGYHLTFGRARPAGD